MVEVMGVNNVADALTKFADGNKIALHMRGIGQEFIDCTHHLSLKA